MMFFPDIKLDLLLKDLRLETRDNSKYLSKLKNHSCWILSFSGGADSVLSLFFLLSLHRSHAKRTRRLFLFYLDHSQKIADSKKKEREKLFSQIRLALTNVKGLSVEWKCIIKDVPEIARRSASSFEYTGSRIRKNELRRLGGRYKGIIVLGHNLSDWYETMIMRMNRGTSLKKLIPFHFHEESISQIYVRPLYLCFRNEVRSILKQNGIPFWDDPTNQDELILRNRIRKSFKIFNEGGLRRSALRLLEEKERMNFPFEIISPDRELRIQVDKILDLQPNFLREMDRIALDYLGLGALSKRLYRQLEVNGLSFPPFFIEVENWNFTLYRTYRRGRSSLEGSRQEAKKIIDHIFIKKESISYRLIAADQITKSYKIRFSYGRKNVKELLKEKNISERQRKNLFLAAELNDPKSILVIPLAIFGLKSIYCHRF